jgi:hypothetical protein
MKPKLQFVYAVDGGVVAGLFDYVHKIVKPSTYPCSLCALTYGPTGKRGAWARALAELDLDAEFLHRDELVRLDGPDHPPLPAVFTVRDGARELLLSKADIDGCRDLDALIALLQARVPVSAKAVR